jgi:oligosaccharide repeat unit polymerase
MFNYILVISLIAIWMLIYYLNGRQFFSPSIFMTSTFIIASIVCCVNANLWRVNLGIWTVVVICSGILIFAIGEAVGSNKSVILKTGINIFNIGETDSKIIKVRPRIMILVVAIMVITSVFYFRYIYRISLVAGNPLGYAGMFKYARYAVINTKYEVSPGFLLSHGLLISECFGFIFLFIILYNKILYDKFGAIVFIPCILYILQISISTARLDYISYLGGGIVIYFLISMKKENFNVHLNLKTILIALGIVFLVFFGFRLLGNLTGKSATRELWSDISNYTGSSIAAFDWYLKVPRTPNAFFGKETLRNIYKMLYGVGLTDIEPYNASLPFVYFQRNIRTNIYTAFRRLIQDYGYIGMYMIMLFEGFFYGAWTRSLKMKNIAGLGIIVYAYMFFPVIFAFIDEQFVLNFTTIRIVYMLIYFALFYKLIIGSNMVVAGNAEEN